MQDTKLRMYQVIIPYYHKFIVSAEDEDDAVQVAHNSTGTIIGYSDKGVQVLELSF